MKDLSVFEHLPDNARVWLYQSNKALPLDTQENITKELQDFVASWAAHGSQLFGAAAAINERFLLVAVDEAKVPPSGCSIDSSVRFIKTLEKKYGIDLFSRINVFLLEEGKIMPLPYSELSNCNENVLVFDNLVQQLGEVRNNWPVALRTSNFASVLT